MLDYSYTALDYLQKIGLFNAFHQEEECSDISLQ